MSIAIARSSVIAAVALLGLHGVALAANPTTLEFGAETTVDGVDVACTGVGQTRFDPRWSAFPVRVEFSNARNEYLTDGEITVTDAKRRPVVALRCEGPWILLKLKPGAYRVEGRLVDGPAKPQSADFRPPAGGQMRLVLKFPDVEAGQSESSR